MRVELIVSQFEHVQPIKVEGEQMIKIIADADMHLLLDGDQNFFYLKGVIDVAFMIYKSELIPKSRNFSYNVRHQYGFIKIKYAYIDGYVGLPFKGDNLQPPDGFDDHYFEETKNFNIKTSKDEVIKFISDLCEEISDLPEPQLLEYEPFEE